MIAFLAQHVRDRESQAHLFRVVAETVRARFDPDDAAIVAAWFDRLAVGESPGSVFAAPKGRTRGRTKPRKPMGDGRIPTDVDITWLVRQGIEGGIEPNDCYQLVADRYGMSKGNVRNIYGRWKNRIG